MNCSKRNISLAFLLVIIFCCQSFVRRQDRIKITIPTGWPQPVYNTRQNPVTRAGFTLGRKLFYDPVLSRDNTISCAHCHSQFSAFTHGDHGLSHGIDGLRGTRNSLVLFNLAWNTSFMWDGGINHLEVQPLGPITNKAEMDNNLAAIITRLDTSMVYKSMFAAAWGDSNITGQRILRSMAQFLVMFQSYNSRYDKYVRKEAGGEMTPQELNGLSLFRKHCAECHKEPLFTDYSFRNIGLPVDTGLNDYGRMKITGRSSDSLKFKVPTLRNIELSYPYMHDGRFKTLRQALNHYTDGVILSSTTDPLVAKKIVLTSNDKTDIVAFLLTLSDKEFVLNKELHQPMHQD